MPYMRIFWVTVVIFGVDRFTKIWVVDWLNLSSIYSIEVWPPFLNLEMAWNDGINFGLFGSGSDTAKWVLIGIALAISVVLLVLVRKSKGWIIPVSTGMVIGGALGNVYDRIIFGAVADFLNMSCCGFDNPYSFNVADAAIFIGIVGLVIFLDDKKKAKS